MLRLDINLVFTIVNLLLLFGIMTKFLFKPVNKIIAQRDEMIKQQFADAQKTQEQADDLKRQYEELIGNAKSDSAKIIREAKEKARVEYDRIVQTANEEVAEKLRNAEIIIAEEKIKSLRNMEMDIENLVVAAASKVVGDKVTVENSQKLYDDFLAEMGESK